MPQYRITLGYPMAPGSPLDRQEPKLFLASKRHTVDVTKMAWSGGNFNMLWGTALARAVKGQATHFAMLHQDVEPEPGWLDTLVEIADLRRADFVSVAVPIKGYSGVCSCGIGRRNNPWNAKRRFTVRELNRMPQTFHEADVGYHGEMLLHNDGCILVDLRNERWFDTDDAGNLKFLFQFVGRLRRDGDEIAYSFEPEDWYFSRMLYEANINTCITRAVKLTHGGFPNYGDWGEETDPETNGELKRK